MRDVDGIGESMHTLMADLFPICRSITGNGFRQSLEILRRHISLEIHQVPSGTQVFDWTIPKEWNITDAWVKDPKGNKIIDFHKHTLHILNYSVPVRMKVPLAQLKKHVFSLPEKPDLIPYRTSYYEENWGFCLPHNQLRKLEEGEYEVCIESSLENGHLTYGEYFLRGEMEDEILISTHCCHPSMCNDNLSGMTLTTFLASRLSELPKRKYSYRFLFIPGAIGSIAWLSRNEKNVSRVKHGLVVACVGDSGNFTYKRSRQGRAMIDRAAEHVLKHLGRPFRTKEFSPYGYDERQYCSPGFDLPVGALSRTPHSEFPEYHTSADNLEFVKSEFLAESLDVYLKVLRLLEENKSYQNLHPKCEPQLGKRGLYSAIGGKQDPAQQELAMLWVLNLSDGKHDLLEIAERANLSFSEIAESALLLRSHGILKELEGGML